MARRQPFIFTLFAKLIQYGTFEVRFANGEAYKAVGAQQGPAVIVSLPSAWLLWRFIWRADLAIPEAYMDGRLQLIDTSLEAFLRLLLMNKRHYQTRAFMRARIKLASFLCLFKSAIWQKQAKANVAHHYDLTDALYDCFLGRRRQYSCAYFRDGDDLDAAQLRKIARLAAKLDIKSDQHILDIGCGWGELARALTECEPDIKVTGITLSEQQLAYAKQHVLPRTGAKVSFDLCDYRDHQGCYDRIISVGMLEHVGQKQFKRYFQTIDALLAEDGRAVIHTIGKQHKDPLGNGFIGKYIFPGGYLPTLAELTDAISHTNLHILDIEALHLHYRDTLLAWDRKFTAAKEEMIQLYDEKFYRMWRFYLVGCALFFELDEGVVYQITCTTSHGQTPSKRDDIHQNEIRYLAKLWHKQIDSGKKRHSQT